MKNLAICNLGCSKNIVDGETMVGLCASNGYTVVDDYALADVIVVNTCAFIREAKEEAIDQIMELAGYKTSGRCTTLVVAGCFSERYRDEVQGQFPEVDLWTGVDDWLPKLVSHLHLTKSDTIVRRSLTSPIATQYIKIAEGCSHRCSFCVIPSIRGPFRSRPIGEVVDEARWLADQGARECILVAQDTSRFGDDIGSSLVELTETLLAKTTFAWIRLMYLHPTRISDALLRLINAEPRLCSYLDIPLQHISTPLLRAMQRGQTSQELYSLVERIRTLAPAVAIRTAFILGFPGETDAHVRELLDFIEFSRFEKLGVFPFSPEEGTPAFNMHPRPRGATATRRCETVMTLQREISREIGESRIGLTVPVMIDQVADDPTQGFEGRTQWDAPEIDGRIFVTGEGISAGAIVPVKITGADDYDLMGSVALASPN